MKNNANNIMEARLIGLTIGILAFGMLCFIFYIVMDVSALDNPIVGTLPISISLFSVVIGFYAAKSFTSLKDKNESIDDN